MSRRRRKKTQIVLTRLVVIAAALITVAAGALVVKLHSKPTAGRAANPAAPPSAAARPKPRTFLGVYTPGVPQSYAGIQAFTALTGVRPGVVVYYSGWMEPFQARFAEMAARHHAAPLVQIDPTAISLTAIAAGRYDPYLRSYADAVRAFRGRVIISFGHEMNGNWYSWGNKHSSPAAFVAAWRHIVTVFRQQRAGNVTWLWSVNVIDPEARDPVPGPLVARQPLRDVGGHRWLLHQAVVDVRLAVRADHQGRAQADPRPGTDLRDGRRVRRRQASEDR